MINKYIKTVILMLIVSYSYSQSKKETYAALVKEGWSSWLQKDTLQAISLYEKAFEINKEAPLSHRYNASCILALSNKKDRAFYHLFIIANKLKWSNINHLNNDTDLNGLHSDSRWEKLKEIVLKNKENEEAHFDKDLVAILDQIYFDDQSTRNKIRSTEKDYGRESKEMDALWQDILKRDSINLVKVRTILDQNGWPSKKRIGSRGTSTLFLVIQHADKEVQEQYLPLIKKAMKENNLPKRQYAMFYDRLLLRRGQKQVYGTQLAMSKESKNPYVLPLEDPKNVDERRAEMGLNSMQENLNRWNLTWDVEAYIKMLPDLVAKEKELNNKQNK